MKKAYLADIGLNTGIRFDNMILLTYYQKMGIIKERINDELYLSFIFFSVFLKIKILVFQIEHSLN